MSKRILRTSLKKPKMETICLDTSDDSDCSIVTIKLNNSDAEYILSDNSSIDSPKKKIKKPLKTKTSKEKKSQTKIKRTLVAKTTKLFGDGAKFETENENSKLKKSLKRSHSSENLSDTKRIKLKNKTGKSTNSTNSKFRFGWMEEDLLAERENLNRNIARSVITLFKDGNTIPFMARYRKHLTGNMCSEKIRFVKDTYEEICLLRTKCVNACNATEKSGDLTQELQDALLNCKSIAEFEHIYAPYKQKRSTRAERAKNLGLEEPALGILTGSKEISLHSLVEETGPKGLNTLKDVENGVISIMAHHIVHDTEVLNFVREKKPFLNLKLETKISNTAKLNVDKNIYKFERYFDEQFSVNYIKPHQILAINRGENLKCLSVKVVVPHFFFRQFKSFCQQKWHIEINSFSLRVRLFEQVCTEVYTKNICPLISRKTRAELKAIAHKASKEVFAENLEKLLLEKPIKGKAIMGIDPGFQAGCKLAVVSALGAVLDTGVIFPHNGKSTNDMEMMRNLLLKHQCSLIALGNGQGCRETEKFLTDLIKANYFYPLDVSYTIVDERGASVYSVSEEAKKEFPGLCVLQIGAISLARRLQDPLAELVKIDPKSLGVGMYQHDLSPKILESTLNEVVSECVSNVGVDLNTASYCLLRRLAGMTSQRAENIINHRTKYGPFTNRQQLKDVAGIGEKVFIQCAGFSRIVPQDPKNSKEFYDRPETTPLDATNIHPESYDLAEKICEKFGLYYKQIGQPDFIKTFQKCLANTTVEKLAEEFNSTEQTIELIVDCLSRRLNHDLREEISHGPLFKKDVTNISDLRVGLILTGRVANVTHFGAFVDIGVCRNGLIHNSAMRGFKLQLGHRVEVEILNVENDGNRIGLQLEKIL